jgi:hypothetical protein
MIDNKPQAAEAIAQVLRRVFKAERGKQPTVVVQWVEVA